MKNVYKAAILSICIANHAIGDATLEKGAKASIVISPIKIMDSVKILAQEEGHFTSLERIGDTLQTQFKASRSKRRLFNKLYVKL